MVTENKSRLGTYVTTTVTGEPVRAFIPPGLPPNPAVELASLYQHLDRANQALGRLDGLTTLLPDTKFFLYLYIRKRRCCRPKLRERNHHSLICCYLRATQNLGSRLMTSRRCQTTSLRCNTGFVGSRAASLSLSDSYAKFTPSCCAGGEPTELRGSFVVLRTGLAARVPAMLLLSRLRQSG